MKSFFTALTFATAALAAGRTSAPEGCAVVKKSPGSGQFGTIQKAVDAGKPCVFVDQGTYTEQVLVPASAEGLVIYGYTADTAGYAGNKVTITGKKSQADGLSNDQTATLRVKAKNVRVYNVNVANTYGKGSQAVALSAYADSGYYGCQFTGYQDTVLSEKGSQLYAGCMIQGATDFIFGQNAMSWFEKTDIRVVAASKGYVTANGRKTTSDKSYYVFNNCDIAAASGQTVAEGAYYLGRPWGVAAQVAFQKTTMSGVINSAGWVVWNKGDERTASVSFGEFQNTGKGSLGTRAKFSKKLDAALKPEAILGGGYTSAGYFDASYM